MGKELHFMLHWRPFASCFYCLLIKFALLPFLRLRLACVTGHGGKKDTCKFRGRRDGKSWRNHKKCKFKITNQQDKKQMANNIENGPLLGLFGAVPNICQKAPLFVLRATRVSRNTFFFSTKNFRLMSISIPRGQNWV